MPTADPHSYSDLSQGRIKHIVLHINVDFQTRILRVRADYQLEKPGGGLATPATGSLFLDSRYS